MRPEKRYRIRNVEMNEIVFEGTTKECAEFLGITRESFYSRSYTGGFCKKWSIEDGPTDAELDREAIRKWDEFTEPLRRKYGIKKYIGD